MSDTERRGEDARRAERIVKVRELIGDGHEMFSDQDISVALGWYVRPDYAARHLTFKARTVPVPGGQFADEAKR